MYTRPDDRPQANRGKAISILTECDTAMLASVTEEGYPRPVPMGKNKSGWYFPNMVLYRHVL